jgi:hypothetical protein
MLDVDACPIILVTNQEISWNGFLKELNYNLVISSGIVIGSSRNFAKMSNPL